LHSDKETREWTVSDDALPSSWADYAARIAKTHCTMEERGIDLLIATDASNLAWLTGYDG
jgi:ectoine hydrolase